MLKIKFANISMMIELHSKSIVVFYVFVYLLCSGKILGFHIISPLRSSSCNYPLLYSHDSSLFHHRIHPSIAISREKSLDLSVTNQVDVYVNPTEGSSISKSTSERFFNLLRNLWDFSRPHTLVGSGLSLLSLYMYAIPISQWFSFKFVYSFLFALIPSLLMNVYITGLNQLTDIDIDKINKPYLPLASGKLSSRRGTIIVLSSLLISLAYAVKADSFLQLTLVGSCILGTLYSLPPFRLKRFPLLAAFCILVVRGSLVNLGFFLSSKVSIVGDKIPSLLDGIKLFPDSLLITIFFAVYGIVIALMKDVPDVAGDVVGKIPSFSVQLGPKKMLRLARVLLLTLLSGTGLAMVVSTWITRQHLTANLSIYRYLVGSSLVALGLDVRRRGKVIDVEQEHVVFDYYMHVWKVFYACYVFLPFIR